MSPLEVEIAGLAEELVEKLKSVTSHTDRVLSDEQEKDLKAKIESLSMRLTKLHTDIQADLAAHTHGPQSLADDRRTQEHYVKQLDLASRANVRAYIELLKAWEESNLIKKDVSLEDCFKWDGKLKALNRLDSKVAWLAQALHKVACAVDALQANFEKVDFFAPVQNEEDDVDPDFARLASRLAMLGRLGVLPGVSGVKIRTVRVPSGDSGNSDQKPPNCHQQ